MKAEIFYAELHQLLAALDQLLLGKAVFRIPRVVHNPVADLINAARVIAAAYGFRHAAFLLEKINMRKVIQINVSSQLPCLRKLAGRRIV